MHHLHPTTNQQSRRGTGIGDDKTNLGLVKKITKHWLAEEFYRMNAFYLSKSSFFKNFLFCLSASIRSLSSFLIFWRPLSSTSFIILRSVSIKCSSSVMKCLLYLCYLNIILY